MIDHDAGWLNLLNWLNTSHGMDIQNIKVVRKEQPGSGFGLFASCELSPRTALFTIPASALLNVKTLRPHYPQCGLLNATQLISLHLSRFRQAGSGDPLFGPYLSILPKSFDFHPLTIGIQSLRAIVPPSTLASLHALTARFQADLSAVSAEFPTDTADFLWAWLNVNTRCIYHRLRTNQADPDNLTLCPILDFANHSSSKPAMLPLSQDETRAAPIRQAGTDFTLLSPDIMGQEGDELYLTYGAHCNRILFVEYGFVLEDNPIGELDLYDMMEPLFLNEPEKRRILEDEGYWGDWTLHSSSAGSHPSFRVVTALRLLRTASEFEISTWRDTLKGSRETVSLQNESAWRGLLVEICDEIIKRGRIQLDGMKNNSFTFGNIKILWDEEIRVSSHIIDSIRSGEQF